MTMRMTSTVTHQTRSKESFRFQEPVLRPRAEVHGESTYDSVFSPNLTILEKLDVEWPAVVGVPELEGELRFNLFCFDGSSGRLGSAQECTMKELTMRTGCFSRSPHPHRFRTISKL